MHAHVGYDDGQLVLLRCGARDIIFRAEHAGIFNFSRTASRWAGILTTIKDVYLLYLEFTLAASHFTRHEAMVHFKVEGDNPPTPARLCCHFLIANGVWACCGQHAV